MPDRLYLSCGLSERNDRNLLLQFGKLLQLFPFSKLSKSPPALRMYAVEHAEPPLIELEFPLAAEPSAVLESVRELMHDDCACEVEASWDLWQYDGQWKILPAPVTLNCFGPLFDNDQNDDLRVDFGPDGPFLPLANLESGLRMVQSNIRSLLHLVSDIERGVDLQRRQLWSESGENFAELLAQSLGTPGRLV